MHFQLDYHNTSLRWRENAHANRDWCQVGIRSGLQNLVRHQRSSRPEVLPVIRSTQHAELNMSTPVLFQPIRVGDMTLKHRVVLAPMTRLRNSAAHVPTDIVVEHYAQRASVPGTLIITEAVYIAPQASGQPFAPGIWNDAQIEGWKKVRSEPVLLFTKFQTSPPPQIAEVVHAKGSYIYLQLWALGRAARPAILHKEFPDHDYPYISASPIPLSGRPDDIPRELTQDGMRRYSMPPTMTLTPNLSPRNQGVREMVRRSGGQRGA